MGSVTAEDFNAAKRTPDEAEFKRLANLSLPEYDRQRTTAAKELGIRAATLDTEVDKRRPQSAKEGNDRSITWPEIVPWDDPVIGADLLSEVAGTIRQYVILSDVQADAVALWAVLTWVHDSLEVAPFLNVSSAVKRSGKSTLVDVLGALVYRPLTSSGRISSAALFRIIERDQPALLLDESDTFMRDDPELAGVINGSQRRSMAYVYRCEGDNNEPCRYATWSPKAIVGIGNLPDTVTDRSIVIQLERKGSGDRVILWRHRDREALEVLRSKIARWIDDHRGEILSALSIVAFPPGMDDRQQDSWEPLLAIANVAGGEWPERTQRACTSLCASAGDKESAKELLLTDLHTLFEQRGNPETLETVDILNYLHNREDRPWCEWSRGKPMSPRALASQLKSFKIVPGTVWLDSGRSAKGYKRAPFLNVWSRYVSPVLSVNPSGPAENLAFSATLSVRNNQDLTDRKPPKPALSNGPDGLTDRIPPSPENSELSDLQRGQLATLEDDSEERAALQSE